MRNKKKNDIFLFYFMKKTETNPEKYEVPSGCFAILLSIFAMVVTSLIIYFLLLWNT